MKTATLSNNINFQLSNDPNSQLPINPFTMKYLNLAESQESPRDELEYRPPCFGAL